MTRDILARFGSTFPGEVDVAKCVIGRSKLFLKTIDEQHGVERVRRLVVSRFALPIQRHWRGFIVRLVRWRAAHAAEEEERKRKEEAERAERKRREEMEQRRRAATIIQVL